MVGFVAAVVGFVALVAVPASAQDAPDRVAILEAVDRLFAGMKARDTSLMFSVGHPQATTVAVSYRGGRTVVSGGPTRDGQLRLAASAQGPSERLLAAEVWQDGDLAVVWAPYEIWRGDRLGHCGYDAFDLIRTEGRWQITAIGYTIRPDDCPSIRAAAAGPMPLPAPSASDAAAVLATVDSFFVAMRRKDTVALVRVFSPRAAWVTAAYRGGQVSINRRLASADVGMVAGAPEQLDERLINPVVRVDGDLAMVWGPYQFRVGGRVSHCGYDVFHLVREAGVWRLEGGGYTIRPDGCAKPIGGAAVDSLPSRAPDATVPYGPGSRQFGELRLPAGRGPFPVAVVIHGGCWQRSFASVGHTAALADALRQAGIATWNIEYRTADEPGGGWPGTFLDVSEATDYLRVLARSHPIDASRVVTVGHSAGGHLALWVAARHRLPAESPLKRPAPLPISGAVALGPVMDLGEFASRAAGPCGRGATMVVGGTPAEVPDRYAAGTPLGLLPLGVPHAIVVGELDGVLPAGPREAYVRQARLAGDQVALTVIRGAAHFDVIAPATAAWPAVLEQVRRLIPR